MNTFTKKLLTALGLTTIAASEDNASELRSALEFHANNATLFRQQRNDYAIANANAEQECTTLRKYRVNYDEQKSRAENLQHFLDRLREQRARSIDKANAKQNVIDTLRADRDELLAGLIECNQKLEASRTCRRTLDQELMAERGQVKRLKEQHNEHRLII